MDLQKRFSKLPDIDYPNFRFLFDDITQKFEALPVFRIRAPEAADSNLIHGNKFNYNACSYGDLRQKSYALGRFLLAQGLEKQDKVLLLGDSHPEWCFSYIAALVAGLVIVPLDPAMDADSVAGLLKASGARALVFSHAMHGKLADIMARYKELSLQLKVLVEFGLDSSTEASSEKTLAAAFKTISFNEAVNSVAAKAGDHEGLPEPDSINGDGPASIIYTSGTTGIAKGIMLSHRGIIANINASIQALNVSPSDRFIAVLPLHHTYASTCNFLAPITAGGSITFTEKIVPSLVVKHIKESGVTVLIGVPLLFDKIKQGIRTEMDKLKGIKAVFVKTMFSASAFITNSFGIRAGAMLLKFLRIKAGIASIRLGVAGGGPLSWDTAQFFEILGLNLVQGYGMSENGPLISVNLPEYKDNHSVGLPVKKTLVRIADSGSDGVGEIQVKSPSMMLGYMDAEAENEAIFSQDGWLRTGDLGYMDKRGFVYITGRSKNLIVTEGGKNVYPEEIESRFEGSVYIKEILVLGRYVNGGKAGEQVIAVCYPDWDRIEQETASKDRLNFASACIKEEIRAVNKTLPSHMKIVDFIVREDEFEKTSTKKIRRFLYAFYAKTGSLGLEGARQ